jgi:hypothetical protein
MLRLVETVAPQLCGHHFAVAIKSEPAASQDEGTDQDTIGSMKEKIQSS